MLPQLVPKHLFSNAVMWNTSMFETSTVIGPAIGGLIIARAGVSAALAFSAVCTFTCIWLTVPLPKQPPANRGEPFSFATLGAGVRYVFRHDMMLPIMTLDLFAVLLGGATALLPIFAEKVLEAGGFGFGLLRAAPAMGAVVMAFFLAHRPLRRPGVALLGSVAGFGVATIVFGLSKDFWLSFSMLALAGALDNVSVVVRGTLMQVLTPDEMRGRVSAVMPAIVVANSATPSACSPPSPRSGARSVARAKVG